MATRQTKRVQKLIEGASTLDKAKILARLAPQTALIKSEALSQNEVKAIIESVPKGETEEINKYLTIINVIMGEDYRVAYTTARASHFFFRLGVNISSLADYLVRLDTMNKIVAELPEGNPFKPVVVKYAIDEFKEMDTLGFSAVEDRGLVKIDGYLLRKVLLMDRAPYISYLSQCKTLRAQLYEFLDKYGDRELIPDITLSCIREMDNTYYPDYEPKTRAFWEQHITKPDGAPDGDPEEEIYIDEYLGMPQLFPSIESEEIKITEAYLGKKENVFIKSLLQGYES